MRLLAHSELMDGPEKFPVEMYFEAAKNIDPNDLLARWIAIESEKQRLFVRQVEIQDPDTVQVELMTEAELRRALAQDMDDFVESFRNPRLMAIEQAVKVGGVLRAGGTLHSYAVVASPDPDLPELSKAERDHLRFAAAGKEVEDGIGGTDIIVAWAVYPSLPGNLHLHYGRRWIIDGIVRLGDGTIYRSLAEKPQRPTSLRSGNDLSSLTPKGSG